MFVTMPSGSRVWVPPVAHQLIDAFGLQPTEVTPAPAGERPTHGPRCHALWMGLASGIDDGYGAIERVAKVVGWGPDPRYGDWPCVVEWIKIHDPKDDPDESGRHFLALRLTYIEGGLYLALYGSVAEAKAEAWPQFGASE
jgi:hypothetical protein